MTDLVEVSQPPVEVYTRNIDDATTAVRFGREYPGGGEAEFKALSSLYSVDSVHVAKPIKLNVDPEGKIVGFDMERLNGKTAREYAQAHGSIPAQSAEQVKETVRRFHESGLAHGDLNPNNVFVSPSGDIKIIDPVGYGDIPWEEFQKYADLDMQTLSSWL